MKARNFINLHTRTTLNGGGREVNDEECRMREKQIITIIEVI